MPPTIEELARKLYFNAKNTLESEGVREGSPLIYSRTNGNDSYFKIAVPIPPVFGKNGTRTNPRKYFRAKFDEIVRQYLPLEESARDSEDYVVTKSANSFWRGYRVVIRTPKGELKISGFPSFWKMLGDNIYGAGFWHKTNANIKGRFKEYRIKRPPEKMGIFKSLFWRFIKGSDYTPYTPVHV